MNSLDPTQAHFVPASPQAATDQAFSQYRLLSRIAQGGMSEIYLAGWELAPGTHRLVVLKRLLSQIEDDPIATRMFLDEAKVAVRLSHPNIVHTYDVGLFRGHYCIVMEFLRGQPLHRIVHRASGLGCPLAPELAVKIVVDVLEGLDAAHDVCDYDGTPLRIVHRDISPHNVFVQYDGRVKVLDFGVAKSAVQEGHTKTGLVKGKFAYMAPEQAQAKPVDRRADVWSVGVVLFELLSGRRLFRAPHDAATLQMTLQAPVPSICEFRPELPLSLDAIVQRALERDLERRYASAGALKDDLERWLASSGHKVNSARVAAFMTELFDTERQEQERTVRELLANTENASVSSAPASFGSTPFTSAATLGSVASVSGLLEEVRRRHRALVRGAIGSLALLSALLLGFAWSIRKAPEQAARVQTPPSSPMVALATLPAKTPGATNEGPGANHSTLRDTPTLAGTAMGIALKAPSDPAPARPTPRWRQDQRAPSKRTSLETSRPRAENANEKTGMLTIDTTPWSIVSVAGRVLGQTPVIAAELPAGSHALTLSNPELNIKTTYDVVVEPGRTTVRRIGLE